MGFKLSDFQRYVLSLVLVFISFLVLLHEFIVEGYVFDPVDIIVPRITHEKIYITLLIIGILLGLRKKK